MLKAIIFKDFEGKTVARSTSMDNVLDIRLVGRGFEVQYMNGATEVHYGIPFIFHKGVVPDDQEGEKEDSESGGETL